MCLRNDRLRPLRCPTCDGFPCLVHAKSDAEVLAVRPALEHQNVTLLRNPQAVALHTNPSGTAVTEVAVDHDGTRETFGADIVVVSCGAANSAQLLLASATERHPNGLSNRSDQLGRNYTFHNSQAVLALWKEENPTVFQKTLGLNDFYFGTDPDSSVLNTDCRAHELDNLCVVDTSFFPSIGAVNPALTAMANALRVGDHLLERLGAPRADMETVGAS
jgi:choline dehydrogenase-like flavoprotein